MSNTFIQTALAAAALAFVQQAGADTITFDELAAGTILSNQYASLGVTFSPDAFSGAGSSSSRMYWATNTGMTVVASSGPDADVGDELGSPTLVSGNVLHSRSDWLNEDGDASFRVSFTTPVNFFSATFAGVYDVADTRLFFFNGATPLGTVTGAGQSAGQFVLKSGPYADSITSVVVTPGSFYDWVGVDNITFAVPEPASYATLARGLGLLAFVRRRR